MRIAITLLTFFIYLAPTNAQERPQIENRGEHLTVAAINGDTVLITGQEFGVASGPESMYRWAVYRAGKLHGVYLGLSGDPFLRVVLGPGTYTVIRYTDYYSPDGQTGITESRKIEFTMLTPLEYSE